MPTPSTPLVVSVGVQCHVGRQRTENQDRITRAAIPFGDLFVVADGVGGYQGGAEAAQATVDGFSDYLKAHGSLPLPDALQQAVRSISADLQRRSAASQVLHGMGSTVVLCVVRGDRATYAHAGDSRAYLLRDRHLTQLTSDHSVMERMISQGVLDAKQAREHPDASVLTRAIGQSADVSLDVAEITLQPQDALLLCSDGLWAYARHEEMEAIAASENLSASGVAGALLNLALEGGGGDNVSLQFLRFEAAHWQRHVASFWRMPLRKAIPALALATLMASGAAGLFVWNQLHPLIGEVEPSVEASAPAKNEPLPDTTKPGVPENPQPPKRKVSPSIPKTSNPTAASPTVPTDEHPTQPAVSTEGGPKSTVVIVREKDGSIVEWGPKLEGLDYLSSVQLPGTADCLALEQAVETLDYSPETAAVARKVQNELNLSPSALVLRSPDELKKCGAGDLVAMPAAKTSLSERIRGKAKRKATEAQAQVDKAKAGVDAAKKKVEEKVDPAKDKPPQ
jgi:PPM family protein phosphatase